MKKGKIIRRHFSSNNNVRTGEFRIEFSQSTFGPYTHLYTRENLYFDEEMNERGSYFFPLKDDTFDNTEMFIENDDIVICIGERGSFSGHAKRFIELVNLKTKNKYRFYPDTVSLMYNSKDEVIIYYKKWENYKKLSLDFKTLKKNSEKTQRLSAFFKLLYDHTNNQYKRLVYTPNSRSHKAWYFSEGVIENEKTITEDIPWLNMVHLEEPNGYHSEPKDFLRGSFTLRTSKYQRIDVWEASLTWIL